MIMKEVKYYAGVPRWTSGRQTCMLPVRQQDGTLKDQIVLNVLGHDPWSGQITTEDTTYVWVPSEVRQRNPSPIDIVNRRW